MSDRILFFGNERLATGVNTDAPTLKALIKAGYEVAAVISNYTAGTSRSNRPLEIAHEAEKHNIPLLLPNKLSEIAAELKQYGAKIGVLAAYGKMVPETIINMFPCGIVNIHPSLLPLHRGPTPVESVILEGADITGVSLMKLVKEMDAGPIYAQREIYIRKHETKQELADKLIKLGAELLIERLPAILDGSVEPVPQDESKATYDILIAKKAGFIDWKRSAVELERQIRAYAGWPGSRTTLANKEVIITKVRTAGYSGKPGSVIIRGHEILVCAREQALVIESLKPAGKKEMTAQAFLAGHHHLLKNP